MKKTFSLYIFIFTLFYACKTTNEVTHYPKYIEPCENKDRELYVRTSPSIALGVFSCESFPKDRLFWFNPKLEEWEEIDLNRRLSSYSASPSSRIQLILDNSLVEGTEKLLAHIFIYGDIEKQKLIEERIASILPNGTWNPNTDVIVDDR